MNHEILNKAEELINYANGNICNHCLGRKFSDCVEGNGNEDRGIKIRESQNVKYATISSIILKMMFLIWWMRK